jgi:hypothetical protein
LTTIIEKDFTYALAKELKKVFFPSRDRETALHVGNLLYDKDGLRFALFGKLVSFFDKNEKDFSDDDFRQSLLSDTEFLNRYGFEVVSHPYLAMNLIGIAGRLGILVGVTIANPESGQNANISSSLRTDLETQKGLLGSLLAVQQRSLASDEFSEVSRIAKRIRQVAQRIRQLTFDLGSVEKARTPETIETPVLQGVVPFLHDSLERHEDIQMQELEVARDDGLADDSSTIEMPRDLNGATTATLPTINKHKDLEVSHKLDISSADRCDFFLFFGLEEDTRHTSLVKKIPRAKRISFILEAVRTETLLSVVREAVRGFKYARGVEMYASDLYNAARALPIWKDDKTIDSEELSVHVLNISSSTTEKKERTNLEKARKKYAIKTDFGNSISQSLSEQLRLMTLYQFFGHQVPYYLIMLRCEALPPLHELLELFATGDFDTFVKQFFSDGKMRQYAHAVRSTILGIEELWQFDDQNKIAIFSLEGLVRYMEKCYAKTS